MLLLIWGLTPNLLVQVTFVAPRFHPNSPAVQDAVTAVHDRGYFERLVRRGAGKELTKQEVSIHLL